MTFTISVHGDNYSELTAKLDKLAEEKLQAMGLQNRMLYRFLTVAAIPDEKELGYFDQSQSLIVLSEHFVDTAAFDDITSVFLHELAHALDFFLHGSTGHTPSFRDCCGRLGLSPEFSKSKIQVRMEAVDAKREKIQKLMALSASSTFENEAAEAIRKAQQLMIGYGEEEAKEREKVYSATIYEGRNIPSWVKILGSYLAETCGVYSISDRRQEDKALRIFGSLEETEFAVYLTTYILEAAEREMARLRLRGERITRNTFLYASILALRDKTYDKESTTALIPVRDGNGELARKLYFGEGTHITKNRKRAAISDYSSFQKGQRFGNGLEVDKNPGQKLINQGGHP